MVLALRELYEFSNKVRISIDGRQQPTPTPISVQDPDAYVDLIAVELTRIVQSVEDKIQARRSEAASRNGSLAKLTRMLESIAKNSIPTLKTALKVGVTGSAVLFPLT